MKLCSWRKKKLSNNSGKILLKSSVNEYKIFYLRDPNQRINK